MIHTLTDRCIAVDVHKDGKEYYISEDAIGKFLIGYQTIEPLPEGSWSIIGRPNELTLDQVYQIMGTLKNGSLYDLIKSKNLNPDNVIILIKQ